MLKVVLVRAVEKDGHEPYGEIDCLDFVLPVFECLTHEAITLRDFQHGTHCGCCSR